MGKSAFLMRGKNPRHVARFGYKRRQLFGEYQLVLKRIQTARFTQREMNYKETLVKKNSEKIVTFKFLFWTGSIVLRKYRTANIQFSTGSVKSFFSSVIEFYSINRDINSVKENRQLVL